MNKFLIEMDQTQGPSDKNNSRVHATKFLAIFCRIDFDVVSPEPLVEKCSSGIIKKTRDGSAAGTIRFSQRLRSPGTNDYSV